MIEQDLIATEPTASNWASGGPFSKAVFTVSVLAMALVAMRSLGTQQSSRCTELIQLLFSHVGLQKGGGNKEKGESTNVVVEIFLAHSANK